jgi:hypothetical protein
LTKNKNEIQRYHVFGDTWGNPLTAAYAEGKWVRHEDHAKEVKKLQKRIEVLERAHRGFGEGASKNYKGIGSDMMSEKEFEELKKILLSVLNCKTQPHRKLAISMAIEVLREKIKR